MFIVISRFTIRSWYTSQGEPMNFLSDPASQKGCLFHPSIPGSLLTVMTLLSGLFRSLLPAIAAACTNRPRYQALVPVDLDRGGFNLNP